MRRLALGSCALAACAHEAGPLEVASRYVEAVRAGDVARARALSTPTTLSSTVVAPFAGDEPLRVELVFAGDRRLPLVREGGAWRVDDRVAPPRDLDDPRRAARAFLLAAIAGDPDAVRPFIPAGQGALSGELLRARLLEDRGRHQAALAGLDAAPGAAVRVEGDFAVVSYDARRALRLLRQDGRWRVIDVE